MRGATEESSAMPTVSIGLPVYNGQKYLPRALDSLLAQTYRDFELIISDNGSTDGTREILSSYAGKDDRIRLNLIDENVGAKRNFEIVLELARGKYFMWAAHDDWWAAEHVSGLVKELDDDSDISVVMSATRRFRESGREHDLVAYKGKEDPRLMSYARLAMQLAAGKLYHFYIYGLYRVDFLRASFADFPDLMGGDRLFICRAALAARFGYVDNPTYFRQISDEPISARYAYEQLGKIWKDPFARLKMVAAAGPYLFRSDQVPAGRKLFIPLIVLRLAVWNCAFGLRRLTPWARTCLASHAKDASTKRPGPTKKQR